MSITEVENKEAVLPRANSPKTDADTLKELYPDNLTLKQLLITHRHGDRTPLSPRMPSLFPTNWNLCSGSNQGTTLLSQFQSSDSRLLGATEDKPLKYHKVMEGVDGHAKEYDPKVTMSSKFNTSTCSYGQLTDIGRNTLFGHGEALRKIYIDHLKFLPNDVNSISKENLYLRSTDYPRTLDSLQHLLFGLYPKLPESQMNDLIIRSRTHNDETMFMDFKCKKLAQLKKEFDSIYRPQLKQEWHELRQKLINETTLSKHLDSKEFDHPTAIHKVYDTLSSAFAHGIPLPKGYTQQHHNKLDALEIKLWFQNFLDSKQGVKLGIGRFYQDISYHLNTAVNNNSYSKLGVFSGHDTTVGPFIIGLGGFDHRWPPYGAIAMIELLEDNKEANKNENHYVRVKYNDKVLSLPHCAKQGNHHSQLGKSFCKLDAFLELLKQNSPVKYHHECEGFKDEISDR